MKYCIYGVLAVALMMYYQKNPGITITIIVIGIGVYLFFKYRGAKKNTPKSQRFGFLKGSQPVQEDPMNSYVTLMVLQQMNNSSIGSPQNNEESDAYDKYIEKTSKKVLNLFKDEK